MMKEKTTGILEYYRIRTENNVKTEKKRLCKMYSLLQYAWGAEIINIEQPLTKEEFVKIAGTLGIEWDIRNVVSLMDIK